MNKFLFKPWKKLPIFKTKSFYSTYVRFPQSLTIPQQIVHYKKHIFLTSIGLFVFYLSNLEKVPITGRIRFNWIPKSLYDKIAESNYNDLMMEFNDSMISHNHPIHHKIEKIVSKILKAANETEGISGVYNRKWTINVINGNFPPNAFVSPGGKIFVFASILPIAKDDDGLATILSHEIAHELIDHISENLSVKFIPIMLLVIGLSIFKTSYLSNFGVLNQLKNSRINETEADFIGLQLMSKACFNPQEAVNLWKRMMVLDANNQVVEYMSTHPSNKTRIKNIESWMPGLLANRAGCDDVTAFFKSW